jgi:type I restriction enzyme, R subunit
MNEAETRAELIDPHLLSCGWGKTGESKINREYTITHGKIQTGGTRSKPLIADYILSYKNVKLAVIEAKSAEREVGEGVAQATLYAEKLKLDFAYAANGREIYHINMKTGEEGPVDAFPSPEELWSMAHEQQNKWRDAFHSIPFEDKSGTQPPRFYQEIAVNRALSAIAEDKNRIHAHHGHRYR